MPDDMSSLSNLGNSRWPPFLINAHNSVPIHTRKLIYVSVPRFWGSVCLLKLSIILTWFYLIMIWKVATKKASKMAVIFLFFASVRGFFFGQNIH